MKYKPLDERVFLKLEKQGEREEKGIVVLEKEEDKTNKIGIIESMGEDVKGVNIGDKVVVALYAGVMIDKTNRILCVNRDEILAVLED